MSLLWSQAVVHQGMPWYHDPNTPYRHPVTHSVRKAGFASFTGDSDLEGMLHEDDEDHDADAWDEDLWDSTAPDPTPEEEAHFDEHGEYPDSHYERHDAAYEQAKTERKTEDMPDREDPALVKFIGNHNDNTALWQKHAALGPVDIDRPVHATQSHVSQTHIDRYLNNPDDTTEQVQLHGPDRPGREYLGNEAPMFVTHGGELHAIEGHHRVAAALARGDKKINAWHYDLDADPARVKGLSLDAWNEGRRA